MKNNIIVSLENINKFYDKKHVLKDLSFDIKKGDRIAFIGGNGSGKSTTVEIIAKVKEQSSGTIKYDKKIVIGIQFQESNYPIGITVNALVKFYLNRYDTKLTKDEISKMVNIFRLEDLLKKQIIDLSGGQKQRLNILLALIHQPNFLILDELSTGLDIKVRRELRDFIKEYLKKNKDCALILVTHSMSEAEELANRVIVLDWGKITHDLSLTAIKKKHKSLSKFADSVFDKMYEEGEK